MSCGGRTAAGRREVDASPPPSASPPPPARFPENHQRLLIYRLKEQPRWVTQIECRRGKKEGGGGGGGGSGPRQVSSAGNGVS